MKTNTIRRGHALAAGLTLMTTVLTTAAMAQGPGGFGGPPPGQNGGPGGGGFGGGRGGGRAPFALGAITAIDTNAGTVTITSRFGGNAPQVISVGANAQIVSQTDTTVADLKVGDQVQVQGVPTGITASQLTVGAAPAGMPGGGGFGGGRFGGPGGGGNGANNAGGAAPAVQGFATATGTIKTLPTAADAHISISLGPDALLYLKMASGAKITKYTTLKLTDLKVGDQVIATGQTGADGTLTASALGVNMAMGQGGGFGGPGGFGGGFGGPGGGRGGRNRRGGGGGFGGPGGGGGFGGPGGGGGFGGPGGNGGPPPPGPNDGNGPPPPADGGGMIQ